MACVPAESNQAKDQTDPPELYGLADRYYVCTAGTDAPAVRRTLQQHRIATSEPEPAVGSYVVMEIGGRPDPGQVQAILDRWHTQPHAALPWPPPLAEPTADTPLCLYVPEGTNESC